MTLGMSAPRGTLHLRAAQCRKHGDAAGPSVHLGSAVSGGVARASLSLWLSICITHRVAMRTASVGT